MRCRHCQSRAKCATALDNHELSKTHVSKLWIRSCAVSATAQHEDTIAPAAATPVPADESPVAATPVDAVVVTTVDTAGQAPSAEDEEEAPAPAAEEPYVEEADIMVTVAAPTTAGTPLPAGTSLANEVVLVKTRQPMAASDRA